MAAHERANESFGYREHLYYNGVIKSTRYPIQDSLSNGAKTLLTDNFPAYASWITKYNHNVIGSNTAWRDPYGTSGTMVTLYVTEQPIDSLKTEWSVDTNLDCCTWFGFKFMLTDNSVQLKVPFYDPDGYYTQPTFPVKPAHFANVYSTSGLYGKREAFFWEGGYQTITNYCDTHGLSKPWGSNTSLRFKQWSVVYDSETLVPEMVKMYVYE